MKVLEKIFAVLHFLTYPLVLLLAVFAFLFAIVISGGTPSEEIKECIDKCLASGQTETYCVNSHCDFPI